MTTTILSTPSGVTHDRDAVSGLAVYLEFKGTGKEGLVAQYLIFSEMVSPVNGQIIPFQMMSRVVSPESPQRTFRGQPSEPSVAAKTPAKKFSKTHTEIDSADASAKYFSRIAASIDGMVGASWQFYQKPLVLEVSDSDAKEIQEGTTPRGFIDRLKRLRAAEGFDDLPSKNRGK